jgi:NAD-dependent SIR2 family protein deacetylase
MPILAGNTRKALHSGRLLFKESLSHFSLSFIEKHLPNFFFFFFLQETDKCDTDYLICIGTSLEVYPFAGLADAIPRHVPRLLINRDQVPML